MHVSYRSGLSNDSSYVIVTQGLGTFAQGMSVVASGTVYTHAVAGIPGQVPTTTSRMPACLCEAGICAHPAIVAFQDRRRLPCSGGRQCLGRSEP